MSSRWARAALCALALAATLLFPRGGAGAATPSEATAAAAAAPALTVQSQTPFVTPTEPWFNLALGVNPDVGAASGLHVSVTFYERLAASSQYEQALAGTPAGYTIGHDSDVAVTAGAAGASSMTATTCVVVVPNSEASPPTTGPGVCPAGSGVLYLECEPDTGRCGDVYPVSVALYRNGNGTPVSRFTTFLTYQEPDNNGTPLDVGVVVPVGSRGMGSIADALTAHHTTPTSLAVQPTAVAQAEASKSKAAARTLAQLAALDSDEVLDQSFVPINVASLSEAGLADEIGLQVDRGDQVLRSAKLKPSGGPWVDTDSSFTQADGDNLASGLQIAGSDKLVLNGADLSAGGVSDYTFAQPFTLELGHGATIPAVGSDAALSARFTAQPNDPVLGAEQLLAGLSFVHFENAYLDQRGVAIEPPSGWTPSATFIDTLLSGLTLNPSLTPVTLSQLFALVPSGANGEPASRHLQSGSASRGIGTLSAGKIALYRQQLTAYQQATNDTPALGRLSDGLLATESRSLTTLGRTAALNVFARAFESQTDKITLSTERTVTFTSRRAAIPVTVLSTAPYPVQVVVSLTSDKFTFPDGSDVAVTLDRPTTSVRVVAQATGSGDRLPIDVTVRTADGQFVIARSVLTVHSTAISFVGVALTILAGAVLLVWWARTWRRSRRSRPRAAH